MKKILYVIAIALFLPASSGAQGLIADLRVRQITVTTTATSVRSLAETAAALPSSQPLDCTTVIANPSATVLYVGGADVTAAATKAITVCTSGCDSVGPVTFQTDSRNLYAVVASSTLTVKAILGGGCRQ